MNVAHMLQQVLNSLSLTFLNNFHVRFFVNIVDITSIWQSAWFVYLNDNHRYRLIRIVHLYSYVLRIENIKWMKGIKNEFVISSKLFWNKVKGFIWKGNISLILIIRLIIYWYSIMLDELKEIRFACLIKRKFNHIILIMIPWKWIKSHKL